MRSRNIAYIPELDHLRLLAALIVFAFHYFHFYVGGWKPFNHVPWLGLITEGHTGVTLFFVLSGFIFMRIAIEGGDITYGQFLKNRLLRILPLFLTIFVVAISIGRDKFQATDLLYLFVTNLGGAPTSWHFTTGPAWSISVEFWFYLVFPFLALFYRVDGARYLYKLIVLLWFVKLAAFLANDNSTHMLYSTVIGRFDQFLIGMLAADIYSQRRHWFHANGRLLLALAIALVFAGVTAQARWFSLYADNKHEPIWVIWGSIEAALWGFVVVGYVSANIVWPSWMETALRKGGEASFSFYMWHALIIYTAYELIGLVGGATYVALALNGLFLLIATILFSWLSYSTIERPFLSMRARYTSASDRQH